MGWASGSELAEEVWAIVEGYILTGHKLPVAKQIVKAFEDHDCDTMGECEGLLGVAANHVTMERYGAPKHPTEGDTFKTEYDETFRFDGTVWEYFDDEES